MKSIPSLSFFWRALRISVIGLAAVLLFHGHQVSGQCLGANTGVEIWKGSKGIGEDFWWAQPSGANSGASNNPVLDTCGQVWLMSGWGDDCSLDAPTVWYVDNQSGCSIIPVTAPNGLTYYQVSNPHPKTNNAYVEIHSELCGIETIGRLEVTGDCDEDECGCTVCRTTRGPGTGEGHVHSAEFRMFLGRSSMFSDGRYLSIYAQTPSPALATPAGLSLPYLAPGVEEVTNSSGVIQQVKTPLILVNVISNTPYEYKMEVFAEANVIGTSAPYGTNGLPFVTWVVNNPDTNSAYNRLWVTEQRPGSTNRQFQYTYSSTSTQVQRWDLLEPDGTTTVSKWYEPNATNSAITNIVWQTASGANLLKYKCSTVKAVPIVNGLPGSGTLTLSTVEGFGSVTQATTFTYYASNAPAGSANQLQRTDYPDGRWDYNVYDSVGRMVTNYSAYNNNTPPSIGVNPNPTNDLCKEIDYYYDDGSLNPLTAVKTITQVPAKVGVNWQMKEVSRTYSSTSAGYTQNEQCSAPGAASGAPGNLVTGTWMYYKTDPAFDPTNAYRLKAIANPDGTATVYTYAMTPTDFTTVESVGEPDDWSQPTAIIDGVQTTTVVDALGRIESKTSADILTGTTFSQDIYTYDSNDPLGLSYSVVDLANRTNTFNYACCGLESTVDADAVQNIYFYNALKQNTETETVRGASVVTVSNLYDGLGRLLNRSRIGSDNSTIMLEQNQYDALGRIIAETNALNGATTHIYNVVSGQQCITNIHADGGTRIEIYNRDGRLQSVSGTAVFPIQYLYGAEQDGGNWCEHTVDIKVDSSGGTNEWTKTYVDGAGRAYKTIYSAGSGTPASVSSFSTSIPGGQMIKNVDPDGVSTLYGYDNKGNQSITVVDVNQDGNTNFSGVDRITMVTNDVTVDHGVNVRRMSTYVWPTNGVDAAILIRSTESSTDGLTTWQTIWNNGLAVTSQRALVYGGNGYRYETNTAPDGSFTLDVYQYGQLISSTRFDSTPTQLGQATYGYDAHGRQNTVTDARNGTTTYYFNNADQVSTVVTPVPAAGQSAETTVSYFDLMERNTGQMLPDGTSTTNLYYPDGLLALTDGSRTYPVGYSYDAQGRMKTMTNWSDFSSGAGARVTTWSYDIYRGFLTNKTYDITNGPTYSYTDAGRLKQRIWARGITTSYRYDGAGSLTNISYSDGMTSSVTNIYDRLGRVIQVGASNQVCQYQYDLAGDLLVETNTVGILAGLAVTNGYDQYLRRTNLTARASSILSQTAYGYTNDSRLWTVSDGTNNATYSYVANSPLVSQITFKSNSVTAMTTSKQYDLLNRLMVISNAPAASAAVAFNYAYNSANQRIKDTLVDGSYWVYQYDPLGQVTSGKKYWRDGTPVAGQQFEYGFDDIGNRKSTQTGGDETGANLRPANYTNNSLNQVTGRDVPSFVDVVGVALATNSVTVNGQAAYRKGEYFRDELPVANTTLAVWTNITVASPAQTSVAGNRYVPKTAELFYYDADGNLTNDGRWLYTWDAENRLVKMVVNTNVGPQYQLIFVYDVENRRIQKFVSTNNVAIFTNKYLYDGLNLICEFNPTNAATRSYMWGADLSGTTRDAGGIGGLLELGRRGSTVTNSFVGFDGNGNVTVLANTSDGTVSGIYEYSPFGEAIRVTGAAAQTNPIRFSTKYQDDESDLLYYGYRYYNANSGQWLSRDPIGEIGGVNLYCFIHNDPVQLVDTDGWGTESPRDDYWNDWTKRHPNRDPDADPQRQQTLNQGCIGITCLNLGTPYQPDMSNCFKKRVDAEKRKQEMVKNHECKGKNCDKRLAEPRVYSIHLWNDTGKDKNSPDVTFDPSGKADLENWDLSGRPSGSWNSNGGSGFNFDYGYVNDDGSIEHANHAHLPPNYPMTDINSNPSEWARSNTDFNTEVWCVACNNDRFQKK